jgi:hypothetical protein
MSDEFPNGEMEAMAVMEMICDKMFYFIGYYTEKHRAFFSVSE